ncbi:unnamed protein product [Cuscuta europaea]|uniref:Uncharacterized protein n=1 Tax=Cuscuta europaea TaxID=41803 RepID=A0A9P0Z0Q0_CUSEU|nr:unnamed protein product [Cuscuta europaea]
MYRKVKMEAAVGGNKNNNKSKSSMHLSDLQSILHKTQRPDQSNDDSPIIESMISSRRRRSNVVADDDEDYDDKSSKNSDEEAEDEWRKDNSREKKVINRRRSISSSKGVGSEMVKFERSGSRRYEANNGEFSMMRRRPSSVSERYYCFRTMIRNQKCSDYAHLSSPSATATLEEEAVEEEDEAGSVTRKKDEIAKPNRGKFLRACKRILRL